MVFDRFLVFVMSMCMVFLCELSLESRNTRSKMSVLLFVSKVYVCVMLYDVFFFKKFISVFGLNFRCNLYSLLWNFLKYVGFSSKRVDMYACVNFRASKSFWFKSLGIMICGGKFFCFCMKSDIVVLILSCVKRESLLWVMKESKSWRAMKFNIDGRLMFRYKFNVCLCWLLLRYSFVSVFFSIIDDIDDVIDGFFVLVFNDVSLFLTTGMRNWGEYKRVGYVLMEVRKCEWCFVFVRNVFNIILYVCMFSVGLFVGIYGCNFVSLWVSMNFLIYVFYAAAFLCNNFEYKVVVCV